MLTTFGKRAMVNNERRGGGQMGSSGGQLPATRSELPLWASRYLMGPEMCHRRASVRGCADPRGRNRRVWFVERPQMCVSEGLCGPMGAKQIDGVQRTALEACQRWERGNHGNKLHWWFPEMDHRTVSVRDNGNHTAVIVGCDPQSPE